MDDDADKIIDKWVSEFILRRQNNPRACGKQLLMAMKLEEDNGSTSLKKSAILRDIWNRLIGGDVDEKVLDHLEMLEKLLVHEKCVILESLQSAYCWVAVECTVKYMLAMAANEGLYLDALERLWGERIGGLKGRKSDLVTEDLMKWEDDLKNAVEDPYLCQRIREVNTRYTAFSYLRDCICEHWALMGCTSLELEANGVFIGKSDDDIGNDGENPDGILNEENHDIDDGNERNGTDNCERIFQKEVVCEENDDKKNHSKVVAELKESLLKMQELIDGTTPLASKEGKGESSHKAVAMDGSADGTPQQQPEPVQINGGQDHNEGQAEDLSDRGSKSEGTSSGRVRPHLPAPRPVNVSPLRRGRPPQPRNAGRRRRNKVWTLEEVEALREGVKNFGKAWKDIKDANPVMFEGRSEVDLKDKWRNLVGR